MRRIAIIGLGLIGGSLGMALKESQGAGVQITGCSRRAETLARARERGAIDRPASDAGDAAGDADLVIIATPVLTIKEVLRDISPFVRDDCTVTDVGSTKVSVMRWADELLPSGVSFIGGHPMAGRETTGLQGADPALMRGCAYCLVPAPAARRAAVDGLVSLIEAIGAKPFFIDAATHDRLVAGVSHLPMLLSAAFVSATAASPDWPEMAKLAAGGYRDMSRLASGSPDMNRDICLTNRESIVDWLDRYIAQLQEYRGLLRDEDGGLREALEQARRTREEWLNEASR